MKRLEPVALVVVAALVVVMAVLTVQRVRDSGSDEAGFGDAPVEVAETVSRDFFTLDHRTLDEDVARVMARATGEFEAQYRKQSETLTSAVRDKELVLTATVPEQGVALEYLTDDEAWVLVSVDVETTSADGAVEPGRYRTRVVLQRSDDADDGWLVSRLEQVG